MPTPTKGPRLGGGPSHQRMIIANLARALFAEGRIRTTEAKAKRLRPQACTPVSVRPAQVISTGARNTFSSASRRVPPTVATPALGANPWKPDPS